MNQYASRLSGALVLLLAMTLTGCGPTEASETEGGSDLARQAVDLSTTTGSMGTSRYDFSTTLLTNGKVLVAGGQGSSALSSAELYDPATRTFSPTGSMSGGGRRGNVAVRLTDGRVLVTGGMDSLGKKAQALRYNPATGTWSTAGTMLTARTTHTATLLPDGRVLVAGGTNNSSVELASCELFNPATGTWASAAPMRRSRRQHMAALLPNGKVLVAGGDTYNTAELYDPATNTWSYTGSPATPRQSFVGLLLADGRVFVAGGQNRVTFELLSSAELYNPATGTWSAAGAMSEPRQQHTAVQLSTGKVLVFGGYNSNGYLSSVNRFDPATGSWSVIDPLLAPRGSNGVALLADDQTLLVGGLGTNGASAELYHLKECKPTTCAGQGKNCGSIPDGCGGTLHCGTCANGQPCPMTNVCMDMPPSVQLTHPTAESHVQDTVVIKANAADDQGVTRVEFYLNGSLLGSDSSAPYEYTWNTQAYANVGYQLYAVAFDTGGQSASSATVRVSVVNDRQAPTATINNPTAGAYTKGTVRMQAWLSDDVAVNRVELFLDGTLLTATHLGPASNVQLYYDWSSTSVADGAHTVFARVYDVVGKVGDSAPVQFFVDNTLPTASILSPSAGATVEGLVAVSANAADAQGLESVELLVNGSVVARRDSAPYDFTWDSRRLGPGTYTLTLRARDLAGNETTSTAVQVNIPPDVTPPTATITEPADGTTASGTLLVTVSASDDRHADILELRVDGEILYSSYNGTLGFYWDTTTLTNGPHTLVARAYDDARNMAESAPVTIFVSNP
jgi:hypothetical protein